MQQSLDAMTVALRVLTATTERSVPAREDLDELRRLCPSLAYLPPDDLACEVIQAALKNRAQAREQKTSKAMS